MIKNLSKAAFCLAWSPDESRLAVAFYDCTVHIYEREFDKYVRKAVCIGHVDYITDLAWSPDGNQIFSTSWDGSMRQWDADDGTLIHLYSHPLYEYESGKEFPFWLYGVNQTAWNSSHHVIATGTRDGTFRLWNPVTHELIAKGKASEVLHMAWSPNDNWLLSGHYGGVVWVWDAQLNRMYPYSGHYESILAGGWSADGSQAVTVANENRYFDETIEEWVIFEERIQVWELATQTLIRAFGQDTPGIYGAAVSTTEIIAVLSSDQVAFWNFQGQRLNTLKITSDNSYVTSIVWSPSGSMFGLASENFDPSTSILHRSVILGTG